jgi:propanediol dehydratase small subunit
MYKDGSKRILTMPNRQKPPTPPVYPLIDQAAPLQSASGKRLDDLNPAALAAGSLNPADLQIDSATLRAQAEVARAGRRTHRRAQ